MKTTIFIIPGYLHATKDYQYLWLTEYLQSNDYVVKEVSINWRYHVMSDYVKEFEAYYESNKSEVNYVFGFSFGAMIAFITAKTLRPDKLFLCSLSSYLNEDLETMKSSWKTYFAFRRMNDFKQYSAIEIANKIKIPTVILYGSTEGELYPQLKFRCEESARLISDARLVIAKEATHNISYPSYIQAIKQAILAR